MSPAQKWLGLLFGMLAGGMLSCSSQRYVALVGKGVINNPQNKSLRFDLLQYGTKELCRELTTRGTPLRLRDDQPVLGRFFADSCSVQPIDEEARKSLVVQYSGRGYAWTRDTQRVGFTSAGVVEFAPDFQLHDGALYVYFRPRNVDASTFKTLLVESGMASLALTSLGVPVDALGQHIVKSQLGRGFTVIREDKSGEVDFGLGLIQKGERPYHPFQIQNSDKLTLANDRTEVHAGQQDYVGAFEIDKDEQTLWITLSLDGSPGADVLVVPKSYGDQMLGRYTSQGGPAPLATETALNEPFGLGQLYRRPIRLPRGFYYLILDNSSALGTSQPPSIPGDDRAAKIDYLVQRSDN